MVVEATIQHYEYHTVPSHESIKYRLKDINFERAIVIERDSAIETSCTLRPYLCSSRDIVPGWFEVRIYSVAANGEWATNCRGLIKASPMQAEFSDLADMSLNEVVNSPKSISVDVEAFYGRCRDMSLN